jgi:hypothetical protein
MNSFFKYTLLLKIIKQLLNQSGIAFVCLFIIFSVATSALAQSVKVSAKTDTSQIRIGEQFHLNLYATVPPGTIVGFPILPDTFNKFEIVNKTGIDTLPSKDSTGLTLHQQFTITNFDSGFFVLPPFPFTISESKEKTDTILTEALLISVITVPVDTTKEIRAIKNILDVPFPWQDYLIYLLIAQVITLVVMILYKLLKKKKVIAIKPKIPLRPAHELALEGLKRIEAEKIWQQGFTKKYFSELTDVIRQYIERRFSINAMEQTTDEILRHFHAGIVRDEEKEKLRFILIQADMVKFAKALSLPSENETAMAFAYDFVNVTRPVIKEDIEKQEEKS